jgi:type I restriction enzyme S subunit
MATEPTRLVKRVKLADCAEFQEGYVNPSQGVVEYFGNDVKWLRAVDLNDSFVWETSRRLSKLGYESAGKAALLFEPNTLAISKSGTIGRLGILKDYMCGNRAVINIKVDRDHFDTRFIFYSLLLLRSEIVARAVGSVQANLYCSALGEIELDVPPLSEQRAIASVLGALDDKIDLNRRMCQTLEEMARALFIAGADVLTLGNHAWDRKEIIPYIAGEPRLIRPLIVLVCCAVAVKLLLDPSNQLRLFLVGG